MHTTAAVLGCDCCCRARHASSACSNWAGVVGESPNSSTRTRPSVCGCVNARTTDVMSAGGAVMSHDPTFWPRWNDVAAMRAWSWCNTVVEPDAGITERTRMVWAPSRRCTQSLQSTHTESMWRRTTAHASSNVLRVAGRSYATAVRMASRCALPLALRHSQVVATSTGRWPPGREGGVGPSKPS